MVTTMTAITLALVAVATSISAYSAVASGEAQENAAKFNQAVEHNNAIAAHQQAEFDAERIRTKNRKIAGIQRSQMSANGFNLTGTNRDVMLDSSIQGELDVAAAIYQGKVSSGMHQSRSQLYGMQAANASTMGALNAAGTILGGASSSATALSNDPHFSWNN